MERRLPLVGGGIHGHEPAGIRISSCHEMGAALGRRDAAFPPVLTRDTLFDIGRIGIDVLAPSETPRGRSAQKDTKEREEREGVAPWRDFPSVRQRPCASSLRWRGL